jgi:predicted nucleic acid-binding protein
VSRSFLDTNVFFYAVDSRDEKKQKTARDLIGDLARKDTGAVSTQVIQEFASNAIRKLGLHPDHVGQLCRAFSDHLIVKVDLELSLESLKLMAETPLSFWDACTVVAAKQAGCTLLYTEDLNHGQRFDSLRVVNPFLP